MTKHFDTIAALAGLTLDQETAQRLSNDIQSMIDFVGILKEVNTNTILPLSHPIEGETQRCHDDSIDKHDYSNLLRAVAPSFEDNLYLVPKVIDNE